MPIKLMMTEDVDPGDWVLWREEAVKDKAGKPVVNPETKQPKVDKVEVRLRRIPAGKEREIEFHHFGRKRQLTHRRQGAVQEIDVEQQLRVDRDKAAYCMLDTRGFELEVAGTVAAEKIGGLVGQTLEVGAVVTLDGKWTDALKGVIFDGVPELVDWIGDQARKMRTEDGQADAEALGN
jgi:hypothetical protein